MTYHEALTVAATFGAFAIMSGALYGTLTALAGALAAALGVLP